MFTRVVGTVALSLSLSFAAPAGADVDPTVQQVYDATHAGHLVQAEQMIREVLRDHPKSAKAHYVAAEVYAKAGAEGQARAEFRTAEGLDPALSFANPESVRALRGELWPADGARLANAREPRGSSALSIVVIVLVGGALIVWVLTRSRNAGVAAPSSGPAAAAPASGASPAAAAPGVAQAGGAGGPGILGSVATGLAVGAGVAAGEELVHHILEPDGHATSGSHEPSSSGSEAGPDEPDFGLKDPGSWDNPDSGSSNASSDDDDWN